MSRFGHGWVLWSVTSTVVFLIFSWVGCVVCCSYGPFLLLSSLWSSAGSWPGPVSITCAVVFWFSVWSDVLWLLWPVSSVFVFWSSAGLAQSLSSSFVYTLKPLLSLLLTRLQYTFVLMNWSYLLNIHHVTRLEVYNWIFLVEDNLNILLLRGDRGYMGQILEKIFKLDF